MWVYDLSLEEVLDPPLATLHLVVSSLPSTIKDNTMFVMMFLDPPFPLAQSAKHKVGETFRVNKEDVCCELGNVFIKEYDFDVTLIGRSCVDVMVTISPSSSLVHHLSSNPFDIFRVFYSCSLPSSSQSIAICHLLILMLRLRRMRLATLSPQVTLENMTPSLILIVRT